MVGLKSPSLMMLLVKQLEIKLKKIMLEKFGFAEEENEASDEPMVEFEDGFEDVPCAVSVLFLCAGRGAGLPGRFV